jgi:hypothetical protein
MKIDIKTFETKVIEFANYIEKNVTDPRVLKSIPFLKAFVRTQGITFVKEVVSHLGPYEKDLKAANIPELMRVLNSDKYDQINESDHAYVFDVLNNDLSPSVKKNLVEHLYVILMVAKYILN